jgi:hypothetical protein
MENATVNRLRAYIYYMLEDTLTVRDPLTKDIFRDIIILDKKNDTSNHIYAIESKEFADNCFIFIGPKEDVNKTFKYYKSRQRYIYNSFIYMYNKRLIFNRNYFNLLSRFRQSNDNRLFDNYNEIVKMDKLTLIYFNNIQSFIVDILQYKPSFDQNNSWVWGLEYYCNNCDLNKFKYGKPIPSPPLLHLTTQGAVIIYAKDVRNEEEGEIVIDENDPNGYFV